MDDAEAMASFSEPVRHWFADAFGAPTAVQGEAWKAIARGENAFVIAPTGSGKTLAAFLWARSWARRLGSLKQARSGFAACACCTYRP